MTSRLVNIALFILIAVSLTRADEANANERRQLKYEDWAPTHYKAYDTKGHYQQPERVLELLKELKRIYEPFGNEETNGRKEKIETLISASKMQADNCTRADMKEFDDLIRFNSPYRRTIVPYLTYHFINYLSMCEEEVLHHNVPLIKEEYRKNIRELVRSIANMEVNGVTPGYDGLANLRTYYGNAVRGILAYLESKSGIKLDEQFVCRSTGKEKLQELFEMEVLEMCDVWAEATDAANALTQYDVDLDLSSDELRWMTYGSMCRFILNERNTLYIKMAYQFEAAFKKTESKKSKSRIRKKLAKFGLMRAKADTE